METENEQNAAAEGAAPQPTTSADADPNWQPDVELEMLHKASTAAGIEHMLSNESGIRGSIIEKTHSFLKEEMKPTIMLLNEPNTMVTALGIVTKTGLKVIAPQSFDSYRAQPRYRQGTAVFTKLQSFIDHVNRFADPDSAVFADENRTHPSLTAVLNYNRKGATADPRFGNHRSHFAFPLSDEWQAWNAVNGKELSMIGFSRFLEDHIVDVVPLTHIDLGPAATNFATILGGSSKIADPATLMSMALNMQVFEKSNTANANNLATGEIRADFETIYNDSNGQKLNVPSMFVISIPVFKNEAPRQILARLRFRKDGNKITFFYELWRTDITFDEAFDACIADVAQQTSLPVFAGFDEGDFLPPAPVKDEAKSL